MPKLFTLFVLVFLLLTAALCAQVSQNITLQEQVMYTLGNACDTKVQGNLAFVSGSEHVLMCFDVSNPAQPQLLSFARHEDDVEFGMVYIDYGKLLLMNNYAYFYVENNTVAVFDISNPNAISFVADITTLLGFDHRSTLVGNLLYIAGNVNDLAIWDVSTPLSPQLLGSYVFTDYVFDVEVVGNYAYVAHWGGQSPNWLKLSVLDISNPQSPVLVTTINGGGDQIHYYNGYLYVFWTAGSQISVYNCNNPIAPVYETVVEIPYQSTNIEGLIEGGFLYLNCDEIIVESRGSSAVIRFDISNPALPVAINNVSGSINRGCFDVENNQLFLAETFYQLGIYSPANSNTIAKVGKILRGSVTNADYVLGRLYLNNGNIINCSDTSGTPGTFHQNYWLDSDGSNLYSSVNSSIHKWALCQPSSPALVTSVQLWYDEYGDASRPVNVVGEYLYAGGYITDNNLSIPSIIYNATIGSPSKVLTRESYAYALYYNSMKIFNIADPLNPILEYTMDVNNGVGDICLDGNLLIMARGPGLAIYLLQNPAFPELLCYKPNVPGIVSLRVSGHYLLTSGSGGIVVYSIYNPAEPVQTGYYYNEGEQYYDLELEDNLAYVCHGSHIGIYDFSVAVSNPDTPELPSAALTLTNHPNPFAASTTITIKGKADPMPINLSIYNLKGQHVKCLHQGTISGDEASFMWDGSDSANNSVASGVYFYRYKQGNTLISKRLLLIR
ncbi:MAG: hypothetical protein CVU50_10085 [Candidatus Cloacimonetes bacterium HGW-Cloacimonetes-3]|jgi:hypothetical protein|nr:MAG: hypothetical protein CVU50_10085 [Candidatus Cloacimonetes bacterium HGW-Cloacimonetes-3]